MFPKKIKQKSKEPRWINSELAVISLHTQSIEEFGGIKGIRDKNIISSSLAAPRNHFNYGNPSIFDLASIYGHRLASNHGFIDGNKRIGFIVGSYFLMKNNIILNVNKEEAYFVFVGVAAKRITQDELAQYFRTWANLLDSKNDRAFFK